MSRYCARESRRLTPQLNFDLSLTTSARLALSVRMNVPGDNVGQLALAWVLHLTLILRHSSRFGLLQAVIRVCCFSHQLFH